jgi:hypothetical protein
MEPVVIARGDGPRAKPLGGVKGWSIPARNRVLGLLVLAGIVGSAVPAIAQGPLSQDKGDGRGTSSKVAALSRDTASAARPGASRTRASTTATVSSRDGKPPAPESPAISGAIPPAAPAVEEARRYRIRDDSGKCVVARLHGQYDGKTVLLQPDGQLGFPNMLVPTDEPFAPVTADELRQRLEQDPFKGYAVLTTPHYIIFYQSRLAFAQDSGKLLEELYRGLIEFCHRNKLSVHESEFPLVAVIFATEKDFRAHKQVDPEVQAYYEVFTNRIFFYEESERDRNEPRLVALRKPQTVAHEGAHQILANIGVQPRLSAWPLWLVEGFAEYCATPMRGKKGLTWDRLGSVNPLHMATLRELDDPVSNELLADDEQPRAPRHATRLLDSESLLLKTRLTPTDYAQSWALTHYLTQMRAPEFGAFLKSMSQMRPLEPRTPEQNLAEFRKFVGDDPAKLDKKVEDYIRKVRQKGNFPALPYIVVMFEQPLGGGIVRRRAWVSQSPQMIQSLVEQSASPQGGVYNWQAFPFPTKARAEMAADKWIRGY